MLASDILELTKECMRESVYGEFEIDEDAVKSTLASCDVINVRRNGRIVGIIIPTLIPHPYFKDCVVARELIYQVSKDIPDRKEVWMELLKLYEDWSKYHGAHLISLGSYKDGLTKALEELDYVKNCDTLFKRIA